MSYDSPTNDNVEPEVCKSRHEILKDFSDQWVMTLDHEDKKSLAIFLCYNLVTAEYAAKMVYKSDRTVHKWHSDLVSNSGILPESMQGLYQWTGVRWSNEDLNSKATNIFGQILSEWKTKHDNLGHVQVD